MKNLAKDTGIKYAFSDYPMPNSSLPLTIYFFFYYHSCSSRRSRMTAGVLFVFLWCSDLCTQTCPYCLAWLGTSLRVRGKLTLRKKKYSFYYLNTLLTISYAGFFANTHYSTVLFSSFAYFHRSRMTAEVNFVFYDVLTCVRRLAPFASQSSALPSVFGGSNS